MTQPQWYTNTDELPHDGTYLVRATIVSTDPSYPVKEDYEGLNTLERGQPLLNEGLVGLTNVRIFGPLPPEPGPTERGPLPRTRAEMLENL